MFPEFKYKENTTPMQGRMTNLLIALIIGTIVVACLPIIIFGSVKLSMNILGNFAIYLLLVGFSIYMKESCLLPFAILMSYQQLFNIFIGLGAYF
jgi:hypothetical protein